MLELPDGRRTIRSILFSGKNNPIDKNKTKNFLILQLSQRKKTQVLAKNWVALTIRVADDLVFKVWHVKEKNVWDKNKGKTCGVFFCQFCD